MVPGSRSATCQNRLDMDARQRCFVSGGYGAKVARFHRAAQAAGWSSFDLSDSAQLGSSLLGSLTDAISQSDLVLACLSPRSRDGVAFEAGLAYALGKRVVVVAAPAVAIPATMSSLITVRATSRNMTALVETLDALRSKAPSRSLAERPQPSGQAIGDYAYELLREVDELPDERQAIDIVVRALRRSGVIAVTVQSSDLGGDIGAWSDDLDAIGGNPMVIEVKRRVTTDTYSQVSRYLRFANTRLALIIYLNDVPVGRPRVTAPVFAISLRTLLSKMVAQSFAEVVTDLRNVYAHAGTQL